MKDPKLKDGEVYVVKNGDLEPVDKPLSGFGKTTINWQDGKPVGYEVSYTVR